MEILLCTARLQMEEGDLQRLAGLLERGVDWDDLIRGARRHGTLPLLHRILSKHGTRSVEPRPLDALRDLSEQRAMHSLALAAETVRVVDALDREGVPAVPFKGASLAEAVYGNLTLRDFEDVDLLVHRSEVAAAVNALLDSGYTMPLRVPPAKREAFLRGQCELPLVREAEGILVEIHWDLVPRYFSLHLNLERAWERLEPVSIGGRQVRGLSREDLLLALCVHGAVHVWGRLLWITDVTELIRRSPDLDWDIVATRAREVGAERILRLGLFLAVDLLGATVPGQMLEAVGSDAAILSLAGDVCRSPGFLLEDEEESRSANDFPFNPMHVKMRERRGDRIGYMWRLAFTPTLGDWELISLPAALGFAYYFLRPFRLLSKYATSFRQRRRRA
jgi:hypothetical protein